MARPELTRRLAGEPVVSIEAPSGFGKSTLATELTGGGRVVEVFLSDRSPGREALLTSLRRVLDRIGEHTAAASLERALLDPVESLDAMLDALSDVSPLTIVIDDAHHLGDDAGLLVELIDRRPPTVSIVIGSRVLPAAALSLRTRPGVARVTAADLRFGPTEAARLFRGGFGLKLDDREVARVTEATAGWPAALALAGSRMRSTGTLVDASGADLAEATLAVVPADLREVAVQLAHLPWIDAELAAAASERSDTLERLLDAGVPLAVESDGRYRLPGSFADALTRSATLDPNFVDRVVHRHLDTGRPDEALMLLRQARAWDALAEAVVGLSPESRRTLAPDELVRAIDVLPETVVRAHPGVLVEQARALAGLGARAQAGEVLGRAERLSAGQPPGFARAIEAQWAADVLYGGDADDALQRAEAVLAAAGDGEDATIARALTVAGTAHAWAARWPEATRALRRAAELFVGLGEPHEAAGALLVHGFAVELHEDLAAAERTFDRVVELAGHVARTRARALTFRGEARAWLGRHADAEADLKEALDLARAVGDARAQGHASAGLALVASLEGDTAGTRAHAAAAERQLAEWSDTVVGLTFMAGTADVLDRAGATAEADAMLAKAVARRDELSDMVGLAELVITARRGDPDRVEALWQEIEHDPGIEPFERLRCRVLRAYAALRRDDPLVGRLYAEAVAEAEALGLTRYPANLEQTAWEALQAWAEAVDGAWEVRCLGPLEVVRGGVMVPVPPGRPAALLGLLAATGTPQRLPSVIDALWPDVPTRQGRRRLRQVLYRLRDAGLDVVERSGDDQIALRPGVATDLAEFERQAARRTVASAEVALGRVRGPLLDGYELLTGHPEIDTLRERVRVRRLALLDRLVDAATTANDRARAIEWATVAHASDPANEEIALSLTRLLVADGRSGEARAVAANTVHALAQLDLDPTPALRAAVG